MDRWYSIDHMHISIMNTATCPSLPSIANGRIVSVDLDAVTTNPDRYAQGSVATYTCSSGYILVGTSQRTCESNGQWSGSQNPPTCKRKKPIFCVNLRSTSELGT